MYSKFFLGTIIVGIIASGIVIYIASDRIDNDNYWLSSEITGIWIIVIGSLWAISLYLYKKYGQGNILLAVLWFQPLFRFMFNVFFFFLGFITKP